MTFILKISIASFVIALPSKSWPQEFTAISERGKLLSFFLASL